MLLKEIAPTEPIARLDRRHFDATLNQVRGRVEISSLNAYKVDLRRFGKWLAANGYTKSDHAAHLKNVKTKTAASKRKPISAEQASMLLKLAEQQHPEDGMTALIMLMTGMRESEVAGLRWRDTDFTHQKFEAHRPKRRDWHHAFWPPQLIEAMENWKALFESKHGAIDPNWFVVPARAHKAHYHGTGSSRMNPEWPMVPNRRQTHIGDRVKDLLRGVGETDLKGRASHTLRRTAGNLLRESGADMREVQCFYGHSTMAQSEEYLDVNPEREKLAARLRGFRI